MRVVVTGATGNFGTSVVPALAAEPGVEEVVGSARRRPLSLPAGTTFVEADLTSSDLVEPFRGADAVVHLAWAFQPTHDPLRTWRVNVLGGIRVFEAAAEAGVSVIVYSSSVGAYSPAPGQMVDESWPTHSMPTAAYGREKAYLERYLDAFEYRHPLVRLVRLRPCFVFKWASGSEQRRIFGGPLVPRGVVRPGRIPMLPVPAGLRFQAVHTDDVADAFRRAVINDEARGAYNVAADPVIDAAVLRDVFQTRTFPVPAFTARGAVGSAWRFRLVPANGALVDLVQHLPTMDTSRIREQLGWQPQHSGVEALREMLDGLAEGAGAQTPPMHPDRRAGHSGR